jgi:hypothetical protein
MLLSDLLYRANFELKNNKASFISIFINSNDFKNIADQALNLKCYNYERYKIIINDHIIINSSLNKFSNIANEHAIFEYFRHIILEEYVRILTETERIIKNIIE